MDKAKWIGAQGGASDLWSPVPGHLFQKAAPLCCVFRDMFPPEAIFAGFCPWRGGSRHNSLEMTP